MHDSEIKNLLENIEVQPSARCWEAIEAQLATSAAASGAAVAATQATKHIGWLSTTAAKVVASVVVAAAVATGIVIATHPTETPEHAVQEQVSTISTQPTETTKEAAEQVAVVQTAAAVPTKQVAIALPEVAEQNGRVAAAEVTEPVAAVVPATPALPAPSNLQNTVSQQITEQSAQIQARSAGNKNAPTLTAEVPEPANIPVQESSASDYSDPVLENYTDFEAFAQPAPVRIEIPNVITPNGDGYNDQFMISGIENCEQTKLIIKNRSGATILQVSNYANNWDGNNLPTGTYYYQFFYTIHGIQEMRTGTLTILR